MVSCLSYYNSSLNLCWSVSTVQKQKPIMAEAQSCGRFARVTPSDWSLDNQEVGGSQSIEGIFFSFFFRWVGVCVRLTVRPVSTCQKLPFVCKIETFHNDLFLPRCRFDGMTEAALPPLNAGVFRAKFSSLRQLWGWRLPSAAGWTGSPSGARKRLPSAPCSSSHVW